MLGLKSHMQTSLNPAGMHISTPFLITGSHTAFQRAPVSASAQVKNKEQKIFI